MCIEGTKNLICINSSLKYTLYISVLNHFPTDIHFREHSFQHIKTQKIRNPMLEICESLFIRLKYLCGVEHNILFLYVWKVSIFGLKYRRRFSHHLSH